MTLALRILTGVILLITAAVPCRAELDLESYVELTIARLELIDASWREQDQPPSEEELDTLYASHGTDREAYFCFPGEHKSKIEAYLEKHPEDQEAIDSLAAAIQQTIAARPKTEP